MSLLAIIENAFLLAFMSFEYKVQWLKKKS